MQPSDPISSPPPLRIGVPGEIYANERRVAATPVSVDQLRKLGVDVLVQAGAGEGASILDAEYAESGARIIPTAAALYAEADVITKVRAPTALSDGDASFVVGGVTDPKSPHVTHEAALLKDGARLVSFFWPAQNPELLTRLGKRHATALA